MKDLIFYSKIVLLPSYYQEGICEIKIQPETIGKIVLKINNQIFQNLTFSDKSTIKENSKINDAIKKIIYFPELGQNKLDTVSNLSKTIFIIKVLIKKNLKIYSKFIVRLLIC